MQISSSETGRQTLIQRSTAMKSMPSSRQLSGLGYGTNKRNLSDADSACQGQGSQPKASNIKHPPLSRTKKKQSLRMVQHADGKEPKGHQTVSQILDSQFRPLRSSSLGSLLAFIACTTVNQAAHETTRSNKWEMANVDHIPINQPVY